MTWWSLLRALAVGSHFEARSCFPPQQLRRHTRGRATHALHGVYMWYVGAAMFACGVNFGSLTTVSPLNWRRRPRHVGAAAGPEVAQDGAKLSASAGQGRLAGCFPRPPRKMLLTLGLLIPKRPRLADGCARSGAGRDHTPPLAPPPAPRRVAARRVRCGEGGSECTGEGAPRVH